jgi:hypothetical protein
MAARRFGWSPHRERIAETSDQFGLSNQERYRGGRVWSEPEAQVLVPALFLQSHLQGGIDLVNDAIVEGRTEELDETLENLIKAAQDLKAALDVARRADVLPAPAELAAAS